MLKRLTDILLSFVGLLFFSPLLLIAVIAIFIFLGRPILFVQKRPGYHAKPFNILKLRTMKDLRDSSGALLPDEERVSKFGNFLRKYSIDELPELINVIKGDMSIVGPRPLLMQYLSLYNEAQKKRHEVRPGITGWAQINGRNNLSWEERFELDLWYVNNHNFLLDLKIIFLTITKVISAENINSDDHVTMKPFKGNK